MQKGNFPTYKLAREYTKYNSVNEAIDYFESQEYSQFPVPFGNCRMTDDGDFDIAGESVRLTDNALENLLDRLELPKSFITKKAPQDLAVTNVNRMLLERKKEQVTFWCNNTRRTLDAITNADFKPLRHRDFLNAFVDSFNSDAFDVQVSAANMRVVKLFDFEKEPLPGDFFRYGVEFVNYDIFSEKRYLEAAAFLYRLICSNGSVIRTPLADFRASLVPPLANTVLRDKLTGLAFTDYEFSGITNAIQWLSTQQIGENRGIIYKTYQKAVKKYLSISDKNPFQPENSYYDVFNHLTQAVQNRSIPFQLRRDIETWAGSLIDAHVTAVSDRSGTVIWGEISMPL